ncbi:tigger transposable element-derived protein 4-like, partial [Melanaphis sacchari]|uniref:tigger transposable element-derived protein 4-like n=1 Tax=Melanaphis sacchari TaxID=742174 RepID=UPI000DC14996
MTGTDKRKLLVIGKSKNPRCFKGVSSLPVFYENNTKAWMTSAIFEKTLNYWDDELRRKKKKILLLVDNCPAHPSLHLKFIKLIFLPANTTAVLQPMDQGVIRNIKAHYRNQLVLKMIEDIENHVESKTTVLNTIIMLDKAWCNVTSTGITNCFRYAGFCNVSIDTTQLQADSVLINDIDENYVKIDDDLITSEIQTDEDIVNNVIANQRVEPDNDTDIDELNDEFETVPSISEARAALRTLERFYYTKYEGTDAERKALYLLETSINIKYTQQ